MKPTALDEVCVVGVGARTPAGHDSLASAAAVRAGLVCFEAHPGFQDSHGEPIVVGRASRRPEWSFTGAERYARIAGHAAREALRPIARRSLRGPFPGAITVALPEPRAGRPEGLESAVSDAVARACERWITVRGIAFSNEGHAAGMATLEHAIASLRRGAIEFALVGGVDSYLDRATLDALEDDERLRRLDHPFGFTPGEAAGFVLLATRRTATRIGLSPDLTVVAVASARERNHRGAGGVSTGEALSTAFRAVLERRADTAEKVSRVFADLNGEPDRVDEMGFAFSRVARAVNASPHVIAPAATWGDVGAASGPLLLALAAAFAQRAPLEGLHELAWCSSDGGLRAAALLRHDAPPRVIR